MRNVPLPDGAKLFLYTASLFVDAALQAGAITNAELPVVSGQSALEAKDIVVIMSEDYPKLSGTVARVKLVDVASVTLEGVDTSDTSLYAPGGKVSLVALDPDKWQRLPFVPSFTLSGGDPKVGTSEYMDEDDAEFDQSNGARRLEYTVSRNQEGAARRAMMAANRKITVHRLMFVDGETSYYTGKLLYNDVPSIEKGKERASKSTVLLRGEPTTLSKAA